MRKYIIALALLLALPVTVKGKEPAMIHKDIPLTAEYQQMIADAANTYDVPVVLLIAVIEKESSFDPEAKNGKCFGLMQVGEINYDGLRNQGIEPTEYPGNIDGGAYLLRDALGAAEGNWHKALMVYNKGRAGAQWYWDKGVYTTFYVDAVIELSVKWEKLLEGSETE
jgi:soluble lytic murein transglycosylase-like protein